MLYSHPEAVGTVYAVLLSFTSSYGVCMWVGVLQCSMSCAEFQGTSTDLRKWYPSLMCVCVEVYVCFTVLEKINHFPIQADVYDIASATANTTSSLKTNKKILNEFPQYEL